MHGNAIFLAVLISQCATGRGVKPERPTFSDTFTVAVEAIFAKEVEIDATLYYDGPNNRAVIDMLYQNEATKKIYLFEANQILSISGLDCNTEPIIEDPSIFGIAFSVNKTTGKKTIAPPEEVFHFQNSEFNTEGFDEFQPLYIYKGKTNIFGQKNCDVSHGFTKPDFSMANCDLRSCKSTLRSIILSCLNIPNDEEATEIYNRYDFFRFRNVIDDYEIFQPDKGIFCKGLNAATTKKFHVLPKFINFSYDVFLRQTDIPTIAKGQNVEHHTLWYDDDINLARVDKYEENGGFLERKIYDFKNDIIYETLKDQKCIKSTTLKSLTLEEATTLPQIIFPLTSTEKEEKPPVYVGQRMSQGFEYDVWSSQKVIGDDEIRFVREFYFIKKYGEVEKSDEYKLQLSFIQQYAYGNKDNTRNLQLQEEKSFYLNHVSTFPRELIAFDVSDCFDPEEKLSFEIEISGRTIENLNQKQFMEALFLKLLTISKLSAVRIGSLKIVHQTKNVTSLTGVITENFTESTSKSKDLADKSEPDMTTAFDTLKLEVTEKKFSFNLVTASQGNLKFQATYFGEPRKYMVEDLEGEVSYTGGAMGALAIVMLGIGAIIGGIGVFIYNKTRPKRDSMIGLSL